MYNEIINLINSEQEFKRLLKASDTNFPVKISKHFIFDKSSNVSLNMKDIIYPVACITVFSFVQNTDIGVCNHHVYPLECIKAKLFTEEN
ncbi:hypothetical protein RVBP17_0880 [Pseudomonas phage sp. 30-3]|nr:hypothetical protein GBBBJNDB_00019 [Pseudomonas phage Callisto]WPK40205.1 hypothetical protein ETTORE_0496 [Pseudomonas phage Ettore]BDR25869.1 hypothetical protein RVBP16_3090 [Pseudomonas phage sp. 30-2]BDR26045.1 hypothetical protein RVBP17_0880 [Pseudomonas phage sp. 30-3]